MWELTFNRNPCINYDLNKSIDTGAPSGNESWGVQRNKVGGFFPPLSKVGGFSFLIANFRILLAIINVELISVTER